MKKHFAVALSTMLMLGTAVSAEEKMDLMKPAVWDASTQKRIVFAENELTAAIPFYMMRGPLMTIDPKKEYTVSLKIKADGGTPSVRVGFRCYTADNKAIESHHILTQKGTFTTVAANAAKGDKILKVKNAADWKPFGYLALAFGAKEDGSDLPNFDIAICVPEKIEKTGDFWTITLKQPLPKDVSAGTGVRQHIRSSLYYVTPLIKATPEYIAVTGSVKGFSKEFYGKGAWPAGTAKVSIFVQTNITGMKDVKTLIKDFSLTVR